MRTPNTICIQCGKNYYKRPSASGTFCSWICYKHARFMRRSLCAECHDYFSAKSGYQKYCTKTCANKARRGIKYTGVQSSNKALSVKTYRERALFLYGEICALCGLGPLWNGKPLQLQVDHIDGDRTNNLDINLRVLCPNCHTQTDTYGPKKLRKVKPKVDDGTALETQRG